MSRGESAAAPWGTNDLSPVGPLHNLRDPSALNGWVQSVAANTAYKAIRARRARRWLIFWGPAEMPEVTAEGVSPELSDHANNGRVPGRRADDDRAMAVGFFSEP